MKRERLLMLFVLIPALLGLCVAGWRKTRGQPPKCKVCECKEADYWFYSKGNFSYSERRDGTATHVKQGLRDIGAAAGCQSAPRRLPTNEDYWKHTYCIFTCSGGAVPPGAFPLYEHVCTDVGVLAGDDVWWWCAPP
ncbi:MAG: hypothetical protein K2W96_14135 [Gemmataceae bacterium]|nr:hypothetical protein [Gemmataceae bacterium]